MRQTSAVVLIMFVTNMAFGTLAAIAAFRQAGARIIPVPVDDGGLSVSEGEKLCKSAKAAYLTPAHQFPLGMAMPVERRIAVLKWARETGAFLIEDDYDSEYRFDDTAVRRKPLAGAADAGCYGNSIDFCLKSLARRELWPKRRCLI
jgi:DNA-binding transcriptional MocR family regulator